MTSRSSPSFDGLRVLSFESRRASEVASLIVTYGGRPIVAPALREVPLESNPEALEFADRLLAGAFDITIFLTGVGTRRLFEIAGRAHPLVALKAALARTHVVARGPKPLAVLREMDVPVWTVAPEPNTWRELLAAVEAKAAERPLAGARVALQEYGVPNPELLDALRARGASVTRVPVYQWALPEDVTALRNAVTAIARGEIDVVLFTTGVQAEHLWQIVAESGAGVNVRRELHRSVIVSVGPTTSETLRRFEIPPDLEASHPKIGFVVREAAEQSAGLLSAKRGAVR